jgi:hypothetical protein
VSTFFIIFKWRTVSVIIKACKQSNVKCTLLMLVYNAINVGRKDLFTLRWFKISNGLSNLINIIRHGKQHIMKGDMLNNIQ